MKLPCCIASRWAIGPVALAVVGLLAIGPAATAGAAAAQEAPGPKAAAQGAAADRANLRAEIERLQTELGSEDFQSFDRYKEPEYARAVARLWVLIGRATAGFLDSHPGATAAEIEAELSTLGPPHRWLEPSAVRLGGRVGPVVVALDAGFAGGTFFVVAPRAGHHEAVWGIRPIGEKNLAQRDALGRWAWDVPGYHDGPLGGRVLALPATGTGRPRFLIDAITHSSMGQEVPAQVSVWEWTGNEAGLELIADYQTTYEVHDVRREGDFVRIATKEQTETFYTCGSCDDPRGTWSLGLVSTGVVDLGHVFEEPLLGLADDLLHRIESGKDASALAAPEVIARLTELCDAYREGKAEAREGKTGADDDPSEDHDRSDVFRGMLDRSVVSGAPARRVLDLATDNWHFLFTVEKREGADYVVALQILEGPEAP